MENRRLWSPAPVAGIVLLAFLVVGAIRNYPPQPLAVNDRFGIHVASDQPRDGYRAATVDLHPGQTVYVAPNPALTANDVAGFEMRTDERGRSAMMIEFTPSGRRRLADLTRQNVHRPLAIVVGERVLLAPQLQQEVTDGRVQITGAFSRYEWQVLMEAIAPASPVRTSSVR